MWAGLGYYRRARFLLEVSVCIVLTLMYVQRLVSFSNLNRITFHDIQIEKL